MLTSGRGATAPEGNAHHGCRVMDASGNRKEKNVANDLNQCQFIGRLGSDPETRYMPSGDQITSFRIAVGWKSKDKEGTEWVSITAFGKLAEICGEYLKTGSQVFVSGRMKTEEYEKDGIKRYSTKIIADRMQMLGGKRDAEQAGEEMAQKQDGGKNGKDAGTFDDMEDDIPF